MPLRSRTHTPQRLLFGPKPAALGRFVPLSVAWALLRELLGVALVATLAVAGLCAWVGEASAPRALLRGHDPFARLREPATEAEVRAGVVRGVATVEGGHAGVLPPLCTVVHTERRGKSTYETYRATWTNGGWVVVNGARLVFDARGVSALDFVPNKLELVPPAAAAHMRSKQPGIPSGGLLRWECVKPGDRVHVEGCEAASEGFRVLGSCEGAPLVVTRGGPQPRIDTLASRTAGAIGVLALGALGLVLVLRAYAGSSSSVELLLSHDPRRPPKARKRALVWLWVAPLAYLIALLVFNNAVLSPGHPWQAERSHYAIVLLAAALGATVWVFLGDRLASVRAVWAPLDEARVQALTAESTEGFATAVRVAPDAPTRAGAVSGEPRALVWYTLDDYVEAPKGGKARLERRESVSAPDVVPVEADGVQGELRLPRSSVDLPCVSARATRERLAAAGIAYSGSDLSNVLLGEHYVNPGDLLYVRANLTRVHADDGTDRRYREAPKARVVMSGAAERAVLIAHGGPGRLRAAVRRELAMLRASRAVAIGAVVVAAAASVALIAQ